MIYIKLISTMKKYIFFLIHYYVSVLKIIKEIKNLNSIKNNEKIIKFIKIFLIFKNWLKN